MLEPGLPHLTRVPLDQQNVVIENMTTYHPSIIFLTIALSLYRLIKMYKSNENYRICTCTNSWAIINVKYKFLYHFGERRIIKNYYNIILLLLSSKCIANGIESNKRHIRKATIIGSYRINNNKNKT